MEILKKTITLIKQDERSKEIVSVQSITSDVLFTGAQSTNRLLVDCDLDSVLSIGKYELTGNGRTQILSAEGFVFPELVAVVAVDEENKVLMQAFLNTEALSETFRTGYANYFSRSRGKIWLKGESSDHKQEIVKVEFSAKDSYFVYVVKQNVAACHEGFFSCFYRKIDPDGSFKVIDFDRKFKPEKVYGY